MYLCRKPAMYGIPSSSFALLFVNMFSVSPLDLLSFCAGFQVCYADDPESRADMRPSPVVKPGAQAGHSTRALYG